MRRRSDTLKPKQSDTNRLATYWLFNEDRITLPWSSKQFLQDWSEKQLVERQKEPLQSKKRLQGRKPQLARETLANAKKKGL